MLPQVWVPHTHSHSQLSEQSSFHKGDHWNCSTGTCSQYHHILSLYLYKLASSDSIWSFPWPRLTIHTSLWCAGLAGSFLGIYSGYGTDEVPSPSLWYADSRCDKTLLAFWSFRKQWSHWNISPRISVSFSVFFDPCLFVSVLSKSAQEWIVDWRLP